MPRSIFITATDTNAGKTWVTASLVSQGLASGLDIQALKPIASGVNKHGINEDVAELALAQNIAPASINYVTYQAAKAPALAASLEQNPLSPSDLLAWLEIQQKQTDITLIEGVGGLMVPLCADNQKTWLVSDWLQAMPEVEVMLVADVKLGCMNQILLSCAQLAKQKQKPTWIVLNDMHDTGTMEETETTLRSALASMFADVPEFIYLRKGESVLGVL